MEVKVEVTQGLERRMTVTLPDSGIDTQVEKRLNRIAKTARMEGFRPGKVPRKIIQQRYKDQVTAEVMSDVVQSSYGEALSKEDIQPASGPTLQSQDIKDDNAFEYAVTFEVYPEIELKGLDKIEVEKPVVEIVEDDIDKMILTLRQQRVSWETVDRESQKDDRIIVDFDGSIDGENFDGGSTKGMPIVLGSGTMLSDFEDNLIGLKAGAEKTFTIEFPKDYHAEKIAGKQAEFNVKVNSVSAPVLPQVDDEFAKAFGVEGGVEKLREEVRDNMQRELDQAVRVQIKNQVMEGLLSQNEVDVPNALVDEEIQRLREASLRDMKRVGDMKMPDLPMAAFEDEARRRVALGLLVAEIVKAHEIKPDAGKLDQEIKNIAATYEQPAAVEQAYRDKPELRQSVEAAVVENQVVETLLEQVKVKDVEKNFYDVVQSRV